VRSNPKKAATPDAQREGEGERVIKCLFPGEHLVLLCERGREISSEGVAKLIAAAGDAGKPGLCFALGGPFGHGDAVRARADDTIRLSPLVMNHAVARIVLLEQLYRGFTILRGEPYHH